MRHIIWCMVSILLMVPAAEVLAEESFLNSKSRGWHWYEDRHRGAEEPSPEPPATPLSQMTPTEQIAAYRQELERRLHWMIVHPTEQNVISYIKFQERIMERSTQVSEVWQRAIYKNPELDFRYQHPINQNALHIFHQERNKQLGQKITALSKEYGLIYIYSSNCIYCQKFAPVVKQFAERYNWKVLGVSIDGRSLPEFPNSKADNGIKEALGIKMVPALIAVNPAQNHHIPIAYGYISQQEMEKRINILSKRVP